MKTQHTLHDLVLRIEERFLLGVQGDKSLLGFLVELVMPLRLGSSLVPPCQMKSNLIRERGELRLDLFEPGRPLIYRM